MIKAIIFDMDGVIVDSEPVWIQVEKELYKNRYNIELNDSDFKECYGVPVKEVIKKHHSTYKLSLIDVDEVKKQVVSMVINQMKDNPIPINGLQTLLSYLKQLKIPFAIASSSSITHIKTVIDKLGVADYFNEDLIFSADDVKFGKPNPQLFMNTADALGIPHEQCLVIEDSLVGVIAAKAARMSVIAIPNINQYKDPRFSIADTIVSNHLQTKAYLETLFLIEMPH